MSHPGDDRTGAGPSGKDAPSTRRRCLRLLGGGALAGLAGCGGAPTTPTGSPGQDRSPAVSPAASPAPASAGEGLPVPLEDLRRGAPRNAIPAITFPAFADDWSGVVVEYDDMRMGERVRSEPRLADEDPVVGVVRDGRARAYPLKVLNWHEIVNDDLGGPLLVTYCPLCATAVVAERTVRGEATVFGVSGLLYRSNLVAYDRLTGSLWSQVRALAIRGPETGTALSLLPSTVATWGAWRRDRPDTAVLLPPPESSTIRGDGETRDYGLDPYSYYAESDQVGLGREFDDRRLHPKTMVVGVAHAGAATAYPLPAVEAAGGLVNDSVGGLPVVVAVGPDGGLVAYVRRVGSRTLAFDRTGPDAMTAGDSTWDVTAGTARTGPHEGTTLARASDRSPMFWFVWAELHPETAVFGGTGTPSGSATKSATGGADRR